MCQIGNRTKFLSITVKGTSPCHRSRTCTLKRKSR